MDIKRILAACDHTLLSQDATEKDILNLCDDAIKYRTASVCIPPCYVKTAKDYVGEKMKICTVIGFPLGYQKTSLKVMETKEAVRDGADEIDMVINVGYLKDKRYDSVLEEIKAVRSECEGKILKVIIETCLLSDEEKKIMCQTVGKAGADFIKTSTGFSHGGATVEDIKLFRENVPDGLRIKAAGGIKTLLDAEEFLNLGADRLGTSRIVKIIKSEENITGY